MNQQNREEEIFEQIKKLIYEYFKIKKFKHKYRIPLAVSTIEAEDIIEAIDSFLNLKLTMGEKTKLFEEKWSRYLGTKYSILVNSGTSANLLALSILSNPVLGDRRIKQGEEVITTPVTFPSSVYPIVQIGATPVFVDVDLETLNIDPYQIEKAISDKTKAILPVHFMGNPCEMKHIMEIAEKHDLYVVEDVCESHGCEVNGRKCGTFGDMGTFSFFFSHHISTIEGGSVVTNNDLYDEIGRVLRSYGWIRTLREERRREIISRFKHIDPRHLYVNIGYNFKPTEINAALGLHQIDRLESIIEAKRRNAEYLIRELSSIKGLEDYIILPKERKGARHVWLGFPIVVKPDAPIDKFYVMDFLEKHGIETRQLEAGNVLEQPSSSLYRYRVVGEVKNSRVIMRGGLFFGNYHTMTKEDLNYIVGVFEKMIKTIASK